MKAWIGAVRKVLTERMPARDDDADLYYHVIATIGADPDIRFAQVIAQVMAEELPSWEYVARARRFLQLENPGLRGLSWNDRHRRAGEFRFGVEEHILGAGPDLRREELGEDPLAVRKELVR